MFRYHCRYKLNGLWYYGIVEEHHDDAKKEAARGHTIVSDLVRPTIHSVKNSDVVDIPSGTFSGKWDETLGFSWGGGEAEDYCTLAWLAAEIKERGLPDDGKLHVGHQFAIGVGDLLAKEVLMTWADVPRDLGHGELAALRRSWNGTRRCSKSSRESTRATWPWPCYKVRAFGSQTYIVEVES